MATPKAAHPFSIPYFRRLWLGSTISLFGDQFYLVALPWLVLQLTGSSLALGTILMTAAVPRAVLMLIGGAVSDRVSPRKILIVTAVARTLLVGAIALLAWAGVIRLWHIYLLAFAFGLADAFSLPAFSALTPSLVSAEQLPAANSFMHSSYQLCAMAGPAPAGFVIKAWGAATAFLADAVSFLFVIAALLRVPEMFRRGERTEGKRVWHSISEGLQYVGKDPQLRSLTMLLAALNFCFIGPIVVGLATLGKFRFGSATAFGTMLSCFGGGSLAGMLLAGLRGNQRRRGVLFCLLSMLVGACLASIGLVRSLWTAGFVLAVMGLVNGYNSIHIISWIQTRAGAELRGRVMSVLMFASIGLAPVSLAFAGAVAQLHLELMFVVAGTMVVLAATAAVFNRATRQID